MVEAGHIGHDSSLIRLRSVDDVYSVDGGTEEGDRRQVQRRKIGKVETGNTKTLTEEKDHRLTPNLNILAQGYPGGKAGWSMAKRSKQGPGHVDTRTTQHQCPLTFCTTANV